MRAIGFDFNVGSYTFTESTLTTSNGDSVTLTSTLGLNFIGLLYTEGEVMTSLTIGGGIWGAGIDNFEGYTAIPIPAAIWLFGSAESWWKVTIWIKTSLR